MLGIEEVDTAIFQMEQILLAFKKSFSRLIIEKKIHYEFISVPGEEWVGQAFLTLYTSLLHRACCLL